MLVDIALSFKEISAIAAKSSAIIFDIDGPLIYSRLIDRDYVIAPNEASTPKVPLTSLYDDISIWRSFFITFDDHAAEVILLIFLPMLQLMTRCRKGVSLLLGHTARF